AFTAVGGEVEAVDLLAISPLPRLPAVFRLDPGEPVFLAGEGEPRGVFVGEARTGEDGGGAVDGQQPEPRRFLEAGQHRFGPTVAVDGGVAFDDQLDLGGELPMPA